MTTVPIDRTSHQSLYIQLYEGLKQSIILQRVSAEEMLPSKRALAAHLGVSVKTVENAYSQLLLEGYIYSVEKKGYFVSRLSDYRVKSAEQRTYVSRYHDETYLVDIKANKNNMEMFPVSTWCHLMREVLSGEQEKLLDTVPFNGIAQLRIALARFLLDFRGMEVSPDQIIIGAGTEYLYTRLIQLLGRDKCFAVEDPGYNKIRAIYRSNEIRYRAIPVDGDGIRMDCLEESDCDIVHVAPAHHFPLGIVMPVTRRLELLTWANREKGRYIIEDDYDSEYRYHGMPVPPLYSIDVRHRVIYMNTFSKSIAPAVRISFMVLPQELMEQYIATMNFYSCSVSSFDQYTLLKFIEGDYLERHINRMKRYYDRQRREIMGAIVASPLGEKTRMIEDAAGTHFLLKMQTSLTDAELIERLKDRKILASCLSEYCEHPNPDYDSTLIVNYSGLNAEQTRYLIDTLGEILM